MQFLAVFSWNLIRNDLNWSINCSLSKLKFKLLDEIKFLRFCRGGEEVLKLIWILSTIFLNSTWPDIPHDQYNHQLVDDRNLCPLIKMFTLKPVASKRLGSATLTGKESPQYSYTINENIWVRYGIILRVVIIVTMTLG